MGRCKSLGSLKSFLWYASQLSGASILCFLTLSLLRVHRRGACSCWLLDGGHPASTLSPLRAHRQAWWLQHPLLTDMAGNIFYSQPLDTHAYIFQEKVFLKVWYITLKQGELTFDTDIIFCPLFSIHKLNFSVKFANSGVHLFQSSPFPRCVIVSEQSCLKHARQVW